MVEKELVEGLRAALARGESLEQAMYTFSNAGYEKVKIEEAARALVYQRQPESMPQKPVSKLQPRLKPKPGARPSPMPLLPPKTKPQLFPGSKPIISPKTFPVSKPIPSPEIFPEKQPTKPESPVSEKPIKETTKKPSKQIISGYEKQKPSKKKLTVLVLIIFLIVLIGALTSIFIFRQELINLFNSFT